VSTCITSGNTPGKSRQSGTALITSLLLLLVLTVLGIVMMRTSVMQERMAGNTRDLNMALQGGEAGLRYGEAIIAALPSSPTPIPSPAVPCTVICDIGVLPMAIADLAQFDWTNVNNATKYGQGGVPASLSGAAGSGMLSEEPRYAIEYVGFIPNGAEAATTWGDGRVVFQVTSRSTGGSGMTNTVVRSTYARRF
jgi:type IV pilus assembly protein PilX